MASAPATSSDYGDREREEEEEEDSTGFQLVTAEEIEQGRFLDCLLHKRLEVCIKPKLGVWRRGRIVSYDARRSKYQFLIQGEDAPVELPFHQSVFQILDDDDGDEGGPGSAATAMEDPGLDPLDVDGWVDLGRNYMIESVMISERGEANFHLFC